MLRWAQQQGWSVSHAMRQPEFCRQTSVQCTCVRLSLPLRTRISPNAVNVPALDRRCNNNGNVSTFFPGFFFHRAQRVRFAMCPFRVLVHSFYAKESWNNKQSWLG